MVPSAVGDPLLRTASAAADDIIVSPIHTEELRHRLGRVLGAPRREVDAVLQRLLEEMGLTQLGHHPPTLRRIV